MVSPILTAELDAAASFRIGLLTLNQPDALNGISLEMSRLMLEALERWAADPSIALVILRGAGERAFCAGGDLHAIYRSMLDNPQKDPWANAYAREFFLAECLLDHTVHVYDKPIVCWGSGIVMGGGAGLMAGASHRIVTETTRFAMPEIGIGLFPDAGATWTYGRLPRGIGVFLALTASQLGAQDCLRLGLADACLPATAFDTLVNHLQSQSWTGDTAQDAQAAGQVIHAMQAPAAADSGPVWRHHHLMRRLGEGRDFDAVCAGLRRLAGHDDPWLQRAAANHASGAPGSLLLAFAMQHRLRHASLADVFREEYVVLLHCASHGDFQEGIRALLIDKDKQPRWQQPGRDGQAQAWLDRFFAEPWPEGTPHPLADL
ncbi:MAG: enoyl-CoA hydratase/isomerase family protein [Castellaniella sp.]